MNLDGYVKSPDAALRIILRHCGVRNRTPHSSGLARLACGLFTKPSLFNNFLYLYTKSSVLPAPHRYQEMKGDERP
jgi:hypothetical protein